MAGRCRTCAPGRSGIRRLMTTATLAMSVHTTNAGHGDPWGPFSSASGGATAVVAPNTA